MYTLRDHISSIVGKVFAELGADAALGAVTGSDHADFQCNGAMQAARVLKRNPREIAADIQAKLKGNDIFAEVSVAGPGFLNLTLSNDFILEQLSQFSIEDLGVAEDQKQKIVIDYGGPNVAKPLHVGHIRAAIIGESIKRIARQMGHEVIGDIHLGDWGLQMGQVIAELELQHPDWPYFQEGFDKNTEFEHPPFTADELNEIYPRAAAKCNAPTDTKPNEHYDADFVEKARQATVALQNGHAGYRALWRYFRDISMNSALEDYTRLHVDFDLLLGESDAEPVIPDMVQDLLNRGIARESDGALVIDVARDDDKTEIPPLMLRTSAGASTYGTTDLATIFQRVRDFDPNKILYVVDKRQSGHFVQVFRAAAIAGYIEEDALEHDGFGTMNGTDGKPFKTREGGIMKLSDLLEVSEIAAAEEAGFDFDDIDPDTQTMLAEIAVAAIKYGDLSMPRETDYVFEPEKLVRFQGKTGPFIQYNAVRAKAILDRAGDDALSSAGYEQAEITRPEERALALMLADYSHALNRAFDRRMPSDLCDYVYDLASSFSRFYKECHVLNETDPDVRQFRLALTQATHETISQVMECLAIPVPPKMERAPALA